MVLEWRADRAVPSVLERAAIARDAHAARPLVGVRQEAEERRHERELVRGDRGPNAIEGGG